MMWSVYSNYEWLVGSNKEMNRSVLSIESINNATSTAMKSEKQTAKISRKTSYRLMKTEIIGPE